MCQIEDLFSADVRDWNHGLTDDTITLYFDILFQSVKHKPSPSGSEMAPIVNAENESDMDIG